jgi:hypothetical protein
MFALYFLITFAFASLSRVRLNQSPSFYFAADVIFLVYSFESLTQQYGN